MVRAMLAAASGTVASISRKAAVRFEDAASGGDPVAIDPGAHGGDDVEVWTSRLVGPGWANEHKSGYALRKVQRDS